MQNLMSIPTLMSLCCAVTLCQTGVQSPGKNAARSITAPPEVIHRKMSERDRLAWERAERPSMDAERRARQLFHEGKLREAEIECRKAVNVAPTFLTRYAGRVSLNGSAAILLGEILLQRGKNKEALDVFLSRMPHHAGAEVNNYVVITYCRLGKYREARSHYGQPLPSRWSQRHRPDPRDLPNLNSLSALEASALMDRGIDLAGSVNLEEALRCFQAAQHLAPKNPVIALLMARTYLSQAALYHLDNAAKRLEQYRIASAYGHAPIKQEAARHVEALEHWFALHRATIHQQALRDIGRSH